MQIASARRAFGLLRSNPRLLWRKITSRVVPLPDASITKTINGLQIEFDLSRNWPGWAHARDQLFKTYDVEIRELLNDLLRPGDIFVDVGANSGYVSGIAAGLVGTSGQVHSFEPVPTYFARLQRLAYANPAYSIRAHQLALSDSKGTASIAISRSNAGWNTMVPGFMETAEVSEIIDIPTERLDEYLCSIGNPSVALIKIDTEGFELPVLRGLSSYFEVVARPPIICEVAPAAYVHKDESLDTLHQYMSLYQYDCILLREDGRSQPYDIRSATRTINVLWQPSPR